MISHRHRTIFIHIPKTGGASIERLIWKEEERTEENLWMGYTYKHHNKYQTGALQHLYASNVKKAVGEDVYEDYFTFSMVRNPWDRVISQFLYLQKRWDLRDFLAVPRHVSFIDYLKLIQQRPHVHWNPQYLFLYDKYDTLLVDQVYRFEDFDSSVMSILSEIGLDPQVEIPHANKSQRLPYHVYYDDYTRDMVGEIYAEDVARFGYHFDQVSYESRDGRIELPVPKNWLAAKWYEFKERL